MAGALRADGQQRMIAEADEGTNCRNASPSATRLVHVANSLPSHGSVLQTRTTPAIPIPRRGSKRVEHLLSPISGLQPSMLSWLKNVIDHSRASVPMAIRSFRVASQFAFHFY